MSASEKARLMDEWHLRQIAADGAFVGATGLLGRLLSIAVHGPRKFSWSLLWELPVALGMGVIGKGLADYCNLTGFPSYSVTIGVAYVGPRFIDAAIEFFWFFRGR